MTNSISALRRLAAPAAFFLCLCAGAPAWAATISGVVWNDANGSGVIGDGTTATYEPLETRLANVTVELIANPACDGNLFPAGAVTTAITDVNGVFSFTVATGCYSLRVNRTSLNTAYPPTVAWGLTTRIEPYVVRVTKNTSVYTTANFGFKDSRLQIIEHTAPNLVVDHNGYGSLDGPEVFTVGTQVCNNGATTLTDVIAYLGNGITPGTFPASVCDGATCTIATGANGGSGFSWNSTTFSGTFALQLVDTVNNSLPASCTTIPGRPNQCTTIDASDSVRQLGSLAPGECAGAYWAVKYELTDPLGNPLFGASNNDLDNLRYEWVVWAGSSGGTANAVTLLDGSRLRDEQTAASNKTQPTGNPAGFVTIDPDGPGPLPPATYDGLAPYPVAAGQVVDVTFHNVSMGSIGAGFDANLDGKGDYDFWFQPIGETFIDPDKFRLLYTEGNFSAVCGGNTLSYSVIDSTYVTDVDRFNVDGATCSGVTGDYTYRFIIIGPPQPGQPNPTISAYQEAASGSGNEKYSSDYCGDDPTSNRKICIEFEIEVGVPSIEKIVDITRIDTLGPDTLTYTLTFSNPSGVVVGDPPANGVVLYDVIPEPAYASYVGGSAAPSCVPATFDATTNYSSPSGCGVQYSTDGLGIGDVAKVWSSTEPVDPTTVTNLRYVLLDPVAAGPASGSVTYQLLVNASYHGVMRNVADVRIDSGDIIVQDDAFTCIRVNAECAALSTVALVSGFGGITDTTGGATVWWETASEAGTIGFHLERRDAATGKFVRVNDELLPGLLVSPQGGRYELPDPGAVAGQSHTYRLVEVEQSGRENRYGPYKVSFAADGSTTNVVNGNSQRRAPSAAAGGYFSQAHEASALHKARTEARKKTVAARKVSRKQEQGSVYKLAVRDEGLYFVDLRALSLDPRRVALTNKGAQVAVWPVDGGIYFYGTGIDSPFALDNIYYLGAGKGPQMDKDRGGKVGRRDTAGVSFTDKVHVEKDQMPVTILTDDPASDWWYQALIVAGGPATPFEVPAYGAVAGQPARLAVNLQGIRDTVPGNDQRARITLNGNLLGEVAWDGATAKVAEFDVPAGIVLDGINTVTVAGVLDSGVPFSLFLVDSIDLGYARAFLAHEDRLRAQTGDDTAVEIGGFSDRDVLVLDISSASAPRVVSGAQVESGSGGYKVSFGKNAPRSRYFATTRAAVPVLAPAGVDTPSNLKGTAGAQYLVIAPGELKVAAQRLADYRASKGLTSMVVDLEDIYDEFNHGIAHPQALRDFLAYATQHWTQKPRYAVLAGNGSFDYRDKLEVGDNLMPVWLAPTPNGLFAADNRFGDVSGNDGVPEVRMGRVPVLSADELSAFIDRVIAWEAASGDWTSKVLFAADNADQAGAFMGDSDDIRNRLPAGYEATTVYLDNESLAGARSLLQQNWAAGKVYANYMGHGGTDRWATEGLLLLGDAPVLGAGAHRPIVASMTCSIGRFEPPGYTSLGEELVLSAAGGAIASWAPSGQSINKQAKDLNAAFVDALFAGGGVRLGDAVHKALADYHASGDLAYIVDIYNLIGDPALQMKAPPPQ